MSVMDLAQLPTPVPVDDGGFFGGILFLLLLLLVAPVSFALFTAWLAEQRGHTRNLWFVLGFFFGPIAMLAVGFAPARGAASDRVVVPSYDLPDDRLSVASIEIDVDAAVFHEGTQRAYGRGRGPDGSLTYFVIPSTQTLRELTEDLRVTRPLRRSISADDVVPIEFLPPELQR